MVFLVAILFTGPALAQEAGTKSFAELYPPMPGVDYYCTDADGLRYEIGQVTCITASCETWMAKCDMSQNNTTWRKISDGCPTASLLDRLRALG